MQRLSFLVFWFVVIVAGCSDVVPPGIENRIEARKEKKAEYLKSVRELVVIKTPKGTLIFRLFPDSAPATVAQVRDWVAAGVYNDTWFHRVIRQPMPFIIQGGDIDSASVAPATDAVQLELQALQFGTGTTNPVLDPEKTNRRHTAGALALAVSENGKRSGPQFVIALATLPHLDGTEPVFGQLVGGWSVLQQIELGDQIQKAYLAVPEDIEGHWMHDLPEDN